MQVVTPASALKIGILGHYGTQNLGDEAIIAAVLQNVRERLPDSLVYGFSVNPEDTRQRHHITAFPIRYVEQTGSRASDIPDSVLNGHEPEVSHSFRKGKWAEALKRRLKAFTTVYSTLRTCSRIPSITMALVHELRFLRDSYKSIRGMNLLIIAGSGQLEDEWGGAWEFPYTILKWVVLARLAGVRVAFISVGAGPINQRLSRIFIRFSLALSDYSSFRDLSSRRWIESIGIKQECLVFPDLAHGLSVSHTLSPSGHDKPRRGARKPLVGINPMPIYDQRYWHVSDERKYEEYVGKLASFTSSLLRDGYPLFFFSTQPKDEAVIQDVLSRLDEDCLDSAGSVEIKASRAVNELMLILDAADIVVATRFHGILLSLHVGTPVVGICKDSKQYDLMEDMGQSNYILPFESFSPEGVLRCLRMLEDDFREDERKELEEKKESYFSALKEQYDHVLGLISS